MNKNEPPETLYGVPVRELARIAGVTLTTAMRWKRGIARCPAAVERLVKLRIEGDAAALLGPDWEGFRFQEGRLIIPGWRSGFTPAELRALILRAQEARALRWEVEQGRQAQEAQQRDIERLEQRCAFYRRQLALESHMGLALARIMG